MSAERACRELHGQAIVRLPSRDFSAAARAGASWSPESSLTAAPSLASRLGRRSCIRRCSWPLRGDIRSEGGVVTRAHRDLVMPCAHAGDRAAVPAATTEVRGGHGAPALAGAGGGRAPTCACRRDGVRVRSRCWGCPGPCTGTPQVTELSSQDLSRMTDTTFALSYRPPVFFTRLGYGRGPVSHRSQPTTAVLPTGGDR